jgi:hypothetical protein
MDLGRRIASRLAAATAERITEAGLANAEENRPHIRRSVLELAALPLGEGDRAVVVATGPSLRRRDSVKRLARSRFGGTIIAVDSALGACLREGLAPHLVVTLDPHRDRIVRWFGDPKLEASPADDYFRRQEMDPVHARDEVGGNRELVELVNRRAPGLRLAAATAASPAVVERCREVGMELYWWNPMYDDYDKPDSISRRLHRANGLPCLNGGGNVGTAAWVLAHAVLRKRRVALVGMDFAYEPGTPYEKTQYYPELLELFPDRLDEAFIRVDNPITGETWLTDPAYYWFRDVFFEMAREADCETFNCTEGGILFGPEVKAVTLEEFVNG